MRLLGMTAGVAMALAGAAWAQDDPVPISSINVQADLTAIGNAEAVEFWSGLTSDLETALAREFVDQIDPGGYGLLVQVDALSLASAFEAGMTGEDARLAGRAQLMQPNRDPASGAYEITATARQAEAFLPEGVDVVTIERTSGEFYEAVVSAFARGVREAVRPE